MTSGSGPDALQVTHGVPATDQDCAPIAAAREKYRPELDGIRALCIIFTIFNHIPGCPHWLNGVAGVDVFFPLSGWLITSLLVREYQESRRINLRSFWIRRIFRILPLYYFTVVIYVLLAVSGTKNGAGEQLRSAFAYMISMNMEYRPASAGSLFGHAWTLGIEEKFYLVWPLILAMLIRKPAVAGLVAVAALLILGALFGVPGTFLLGYIGLGVGSGLSLLSLTHSRFRNFVASGRTRLLFLIVMAACYIYYVVSPYALVANILLSISSALVIGSLWFSSSSLVAKALSINPLPWLGRLTYAIYLMQSLCVRLVMDLFNKLHIGTGFFQVFVLAYAAAIAVAFTMHRFVELPMIRVGKAWAGKYMTRTPAREGLASPATTIG